MTPSELTARVTRRACAASVVLALPAAWLAGAEGGVGVLAGGAIGVAGFRWMAAGVAREATVASAARGAWLLAAVLRLTVVAVTTGALLASGWAHPVALLAGLTVLPCGVIAQGLRAAREAP